MTVSLKSAVMSVAQLQELAEHAVTKNDYDTALSVLDEALLKSKVDKSKKAKSDSLCLLDLRVGVHLRQGNLEIAVKDAKLMVRLDRTDGRGYLRCGQIQRLQQNPNAAMVWYLQGIQNVPKKSPHHKLLVAKHANTSRTITLSEPRDPIAVLPAEVISMILSYLDYREATVTLRVSKTWQKTIISCHDIQKSLDLSQARKQLSYKPLKACLRRLLSEPLTVNLRMLTLAAAKDIETRLHRWTSIRHLELYDVEINPRNLPLWRYNLQTLVLDGPPKTDFAFVLQTLQDCPALQTAIFNDVNTSRIPMKEDPWARDTSICLPQMQSLTIEGDGLPDSGLCVKISTTFFHRFPNLRSLSCSGMTFQEEDNSSNLDLNPLQHLRHLKVERAQFHRFASLPPSLEVIRCNRCTDRRFGLAHQTGMSPFSQVSTLENLRVIQCQRMGRQPASLLAQLPQMPNPISLKRLEFDSCFMMLDDFWQYLQLGVMREVTYLRISFPELRDEHLETFVQGCPNLETLILTDTFFTGVFVKGVILASNGRLKRLVLGNWGTFMSTDVLEWARKKGVDVQCRNADPLSFGRRIVEAV